MSSYDSIRFTCPGCRSALMFQSKSGDCRLKVYSPSEAPPRVGADALEAVLWCESCEEAYRVVGYVILTGLERLID